MRVPSLHRGALVGSGEGGEHDVAGLDVGEVTPDDLRLVSLGAAAKVAAHRIHRLPAGVSNHGLRTAAVLLGVGRTCEVDAHAPRVRGWTGVPTSSPSGTRGPSTTRGSKLSRTRACPTSR